MKRASVLLPLLLLIACTGAPTDSAERAAHVWAEIETECELPCWHGIKPGEATRDEVDTFLSRYDQAAGHECIDFTETEEEARAGGYCYWESVPADPIWGGVFEFGKAGNEPLIFTLFYLRQPIPLSEVAARFGEPGQVWAMQHGEDGSGCTCETEPPTENVEGGPDYDLLYPERGLIFSAQGEQPETWPCVCGTAWLDAITLVEAGSSDDVDAWWQSVYGYSAADEGGVFFDFPGWGVPFD